MLIQLHLDHVWEAFVVEIVGLLNMAHDLILLLRVHEVLRIHWLTLRTHDVVHLRVHLLLRDWLHVLLLLSAFAVALRGLLVATAHVLVVVRLSVGAVRAAVSARMPRRKVRLDDGHFRWRQPARMLLFGPPVPRAIVRLVLRVIVLEPRTIVARVDHIALTAG